MLLNIGLEHGPTDLSYKSYNDRGGKQIYAMFHMQDNASRWQANK
jgi:hypothetical protein